MTALRRQEDAARQAVTDQWCTVDQVHARIGAPWGVQVTRLALRRLLAQGVVEMQPDGNRQLWRLTGPPQPRLAGCPGLPVIRPPGEAGTVEFIVPPSLFCQACRRWWPRWRITDGRLTHYTEDDR